MSVFSDFVRRGNLMASLARFSRGGPARVAFMGGSVTTQQWREPVMAYLRRRFPQADFDFVMAGVGGTDANLGAFRLPRDVFGRGPVDLLFLEFAVNGGEVRPLEGIVRQARRLSPALDIILTYFASCDHVESSHQDRLPAIVQEHERVAAHYNLPSLFFYREVANQIEAGKLAWSEFSDDVVHPSAKGCELYAEWFLSFLDQAWADPASAPTPAPDPPPLDPGCFDRGHFVAPSQATVSRGFQAVEGWSTEKTCNFAPPVDVLEATTPGAELSLTFRGTAIGLYLIAGFDAGVLECAIDGAPPVRVDLFDEPWCTMFHRPIHRLLADALPDGEHHLVLRLTGERHSQSVGTAVRLLQFMVNGGAEGDPRSPRR